MAGDYRESDVSGYSIVCMQWFGWSGKPEAVEKIRGIYMYGSVGEVPSPSRYSFYFLITGIMLVAGSGWQL